MECSMCTSACLHACWFHPSMDVYMEVLEGNYDAVLADQCMASICPIILGCVPVS